MAPPSLRAVVRRTIGAQPRAACTRRLDFVAPLRRLVGCSTLLAGRLREARHRRNEAALSPEGRPASRASTEMSSSMPGRWMPAPGPTNTHVRRSRGDASASRGYQFSGTETTRPSTSATVSSRSVTRTCLAAAVPTADAKVPHAMPSQVRPRAAQRGPPVGVLRALHIRDWSPVGLAPTRTSPASVRVPQARAAARLGRSRRRRRTDTDRFREWSGSRGLNLPVFRWNYHPCRCSG